MKILNEIGIVKKLIIALSIITLIGVCIPIATTLINNDLESKAKQNASYYYHDFVAALRTSCS